MVSANWHGVVEEAPCLASVSPLSFPWMLQCEGHQVVEISHPSWVRLPMVFRARHAYSWLCLLNCSVSSAAYLSTQIIAEVLGAVEVRREVTTSWIAWGSASYTSARLPR